MKLQYLGTAAAEGFPAVFCNCAACQKARLDLSTELRTRSQMLIDGKLLVDFPSESYIHAMRFQVDLSAVEALLVTHSHTDHFYAQEFVNRGYKFAEKLVSPTLDIFGNDEVLSVYHEGTYREMRESVSASIKLHVVRPFCRFSLGGYDILTLPANHSRREEALLYSISHEGKTVLYLNDTGPLSEECYMFLAQNHVVADLVSFDCTFADSTEQHSARHMSFIDNVQVQNKLLQYKIVRHNTKYYVTHFSHNKRHSRYQNCPQQC